MATRSERLATKALSAFDQAVTDLEKAAELDAAEAAYQRGVAKEAALAAEAARDRAAAHTDRAEKIRSVFGLA